MPDLKVKIGSFEFRNPVFTASGTFGYGVETPDLVHVSELGAIITKSITRQPREGNPPPRIVETPAGMINSIGLANIGVDAYIRDMLPKYAGLDCPVIMNVAGSSEEEYAEILQSIESISSNIIGYEVNISCPNVKEGGIEFGVDETLTAWLTNRLRKLTERLLIMKLSPNVTDITKIANACEENGADAVSAINTVYGMSIDVQSGKSEIHTTYGGLSGPAIRPIGVACVHRVCKAVNIPVIGIGGIVSAEDALEYMMAGAVAVQVGTANYRDPGTGTLIVKELEEYCSRNGITSIQEVVGSVSLYE